MEEKKKTAIDDEKSKRGSSYYCSWILVFIIGGLVISAAILTFFKELHFLTHGPSPIHPYAIDEQYSKALDIALQFFDVQKSGKLMDHRVSWRGDSGIQDGREDNMELSKGMYDAGDLIKFGFPMAFTATMLSWAILEYGDHIEMVEQLSYAHDSLKWITDFLINAHPSHNVLYIQVGDPELDHKCWERPETMTEERPLIQINTSYPGTDIAAETAAALASASLVFRKVNFTYSNLLLNHSQQLFIFADTYRGSYSASIPQVQKYYNSSGYGDELVWASTWLYFATDDDMYLEYIAQQSGLDLACWGSSSWFSWDDKCAGTRVLLSRVNFFRPKDVSNAENIELQLCGETAEAFLCRLLPDSPSATSSRTDSGLIWVQQWNSFQHPVASAFLAVVYSDYMLSSGTETLYCNGKLFKPADLRKFAASQADYVLGKNPMQMSYLVGYGSNHPQFVHHRGSSIPVNANTGCNDGFKWLDSPDPNPNIAVGALVGGPFQNESYVDSRNNSMQAEPTTYNAALIVGLLSGLVSNSSSIKSFA